MLTRLVILREVYIKILISIFVVIGTMLVLQSYLNHLKLRSLAAEATSSRLQISASAIEQAIVRADSLGFALDEMVGLQDLIDRERLRDATIEQIIVVSPIGSPILTSGTDDLPANEKEQVLRRVLGSGDVLTRLDTGPWLYTGRILYDSSAAIMGAVILITRTETFIEKARTTFKRMTSAYLMILAVVLILITPFIIVQFASLRHAYSALSAELDNSSLKRTPEAEALRNAISEGNAVVFQAEQELEGLLHKSQEKEERK